MQDVLYTVNTSDSVMTAHFWSTTSGRASGCEQTRLDKQHADEASLWIVAAFHLSPASRNLLVEGFLVSSIVARRRQPGSNVVIKRHAWLDLDLA